MLGGITRSNSRSFLHRSALGSAQQGSQQEPSKLHWGPLVTCSRSVLLCRVSHKGHKGRKGPGYRAATAGNPCTARLQARRSRAACPASTAAFMAASTGTSSSQAAFRITTRHAQPVSLLTLATCTAARRSSVTCYDWPAASPVGVHGDTAQLRILCQQRDGSLCTLGTSLAQLRTSVAYCNGSNRA